MIGYDTYSIYVQWCREHNRPAPTREWWEAACLRRVGDKIVYRDLRLDQAEIDRERREGWAYDES